MKTKVKIIRNCDYQKNDGSYDVYLNGEIFAGFGFQPKITDSANIWSDECNRKKAFALARELETTEPKVTQETVYETPEETFNPTTA